MTGFYLTEPDPYFTDIESLVGRMLSPKEWVLIEQWQKNIPLHIVIRTVAECLKTKPDIRSLLYCEKAVERSFAEWSAAQVGRNTNEKVYKCPACFDTKEISRKPENAEFDWQLEFVECQECL